MRTKEEREAIRLEAIEMYLDGVSVYKIAGHFDCDRRIMYDILTSNRIVTGKQIGRAHV